MVADPASVGRDVEIGDSDGRVASESCRLPGVDIELPQAGERGRHIPDGDVELLLHPQLLVLVEGVGGDEIDAPAVGRPFPETYARLLVGELHRLCGIDSGDRQSVELLFVGLPAAVNEPPPVLTEVERRDALVGVGNLAGLPAVGTHDVDLILARRISAPRPRASS